MLTVNGVENLWKNKLNGMWAFVIYDLSRWLPGAGSSAGGAAGAGGAERHRPKRVAGFKAGSR